MITNDVSTFENATADKPVLDIEALVKTQIPSLSRMSLKVSELLRDDNCATKKIADAIGFDPLLTMRLLKLANSSLYARRFAVTSIQQAIEALGRKSVYDIVMLGAMADGFAKEIVTSVYGRIIWEHSIVVGLLSREISSVLRLRGTEEAFLCGLLHDIGKILLLKAEPQWYQSLLAEPTEAAMLGAEEDTFGATHAEVGAFVTHQWQLPELVCRVILNHHHPQDAGVGAIITHIVNAADLIANVNGYGLRLEDQDEILQSESVRHLKLDSEQIVTVWENISGSLTEVLAMFN